MTPLNRFDSVNKKIMSVQCYQRFIIKYLK